MKKMLLCLLVLSMIGCASKKDVLYFQDIEDTFPQTIDSINRALPRIQSGDILQIRVSAADPEVAIPYQFETNLRSTIARGAESARLRGYVVDSKGDIHFPRLGKVHVQGMNTEQLRDSLEKKIAKDIKNPTVSVRIVNYKITVMGEVKNPGTYPLIEENVTLPQALSEAGDLTIQGERHDVIIIRTKGNKRIYGRVDLTKTDWLDSPFYYLKQNDIVYVRPNNPRVKSAGFIGSLGNILSVVSILISTIVLVDKL